MPSPVIAAASAHHVWATIRLLDTCTGLDVFTIEFPKAAEQSS